MNQPESLASMQMLLNANQKFQEMLMNQQMSFLQMMNQNMKKWAQNTAWKHEESNLFLIFVHNEQKLYVSDGQYISEESMKFIFSVNEGSLQYFESIFLKKKYKLKNTPILKNP